MDALTWVAHPVCDFSGGGLTSEKMPSEGQSLGGRAGSPPSTQHTWQVGTGLRPA